jgi:hypothetical protein
MRTNTITKEQMKAKVLEVNLQLTEALMNDDGEEVEKFRQRLNILIKLILEYGNK